MGTRRPLPGLALQADGGPRIPRGSLSDRVRRPGGRLGSLQFITNGAQAHVCLLVTRTDKAAGHEGFSLFVVETDVPGFSVSRELDKLGMRSSDTAELVLDDVRVPADALLGEEGRGFVEIMWELQGERLIGVAGSVAWLVFEKTLAYAKERHAFGRPIGTFQAIRHRFAELATELEAARSLTYYALRKVVAGEDATREVFMAKWFATELDWRVADEALQIHGGYGY